MQDAPQDGEASPPITRDQEADDESLNVESLEQQRLLTRSPHPYHRKRILESTTRIKPDLATRSRSQPFTNAAEDKRASKPLEAEHASEIRRRTSKDLVASPSESGTEADDEAYGYTKALPAPPLRPRKGLKIPIPQMREGDITPLLTPTRIDEDAPMFEARNNKRSPADKGSTDDDLRAARVKFVKRRRAELARRASETVLLGLIGMAILSNDNVSRRVGDWYREIVSHFLIIAFLYLLYPIRLVGYAWRRTAAWKPIRRAIRLPAAFDPAPLLYPTFVPVMVALVLLPTFPMALLPNLVLGLASVPAGLYRFGDWDIEPLRWFVSMMPLIVSEHTDIPRKISAVKPYMLKLTPPAGVKPELIASLYPLHQSLIQLIQYLTTTSLLPAEVHLMSTGLINLLLCGEMPHAVILKVLLWLGGLAVFIFAGPVIRWNIALARVPRWRFRRAGRLIQMRQAFLAALNTALARKQPVNQRKFTESDGDDSENEEQEVNRKHRMSFGAIKNALKAELLGSLKTNFFRSSTTGEMHPQSAIERRTRATDNNSSADPSNGTSKPSARPRRNTLPNLGSGSSLATPRLEQLPIRRRRTNAYGRTIFGRSFLSLTQGEALARKWVYALYVYTVMVLLILGPVRNLVRRYALDDHEPFGWAIGYLGGNLQKLRFWIWDWSLEDWAALPPLADGEGSGASATLGRAEYFRQFVFGEANTRLLLCGWCLAILAVGLLVVLSFTLVEVDTRRKVFHGMMVAMLLPTIFIDPSFISLALVLILAIFLILDLLRASQLPPLSRPLAAFLTPYVDGRDLRGPVVVSHIFLLIGCAVPLWLSLAGMTFGGEKPWLRWSVEGRDVSMVAGVICVGMGDAAASLIGRRYGRRKWPWTGGKSFEGSAAFALAVTVGLAAAKVWLYLGQWDDLNAATGSGCVTFITKAATAACGASFMEAVLTGGNDNVVVPVVLWLLVKALEI